ncbi:interferon-induced transmembrane protein 1-like [Watersipora subatra]|uniref:interferon-induced transmembrane protein 1-like n=1 Tax=Watersipora subatra TaxID=2589382 RepID=UPI00355C84E4
MVEPNPCTDQATKPSLPDYPQTMPEYTKQSTPPVCSQEPAETSSNQQLPAPVYSLQPTASGFQQQTVAPVYLVSDAPYTAPVQIPPTSPPNDYLAFSIFTTIFCCVWIGIAAIYKSVKVKEAIRAGNEQAAADASKTAMTLNIVGVILGIIVLVVVVLLNFFVYY